MIEVNKIPVDAEGLWRTTTENGTTHDWDMDEFTFKRNPSPTSLSWGMDESFNNKVHLIRNIGCYPEVGAAFLVFFVDGTHVRSSHVVKIEKLDESDEW